MKYSDHIAADDAAGDHGRQPGPAAPQVQHRIDVAAAHPDGDDTAAPQPKPVADAPAEPAPFSEARLPGPAGHVSTAPTAAPGQEIADPGHQQRRDQAQQEAQAEPHLMNQPMRPQQVHQHAESLPSQVPQQFEMRPQQVTQQFEMRPQQAASPRSGFVERATAIGHHPDSAAATTAIHPARSTPAHPNTSPAAPTGVAAEAIHTLLPSGRRQLKSTHGARGLLNSMGFSLGLSPAEQEYLELTHRVRTPVRGCHRVPVFALKGGVGKTVTSVALGSVLAQMRADRVVAVDIDPDDGNLGERSATHPERRTYADVSAFADRIRSYADMRSLTSVTDANLEVLGGGFDAGRSAISAGEFAAIDGVLDRFFNIVVYDCGVGLRTELTSRVFGAASSIVVVTNTSLDSARSTQRALMWLSRNGFDHLLRKMVVVINRAQSGTPFIDVDDLEQRLVQGYRCRVHRIPWDPHLAESATIDLRLLKKKTLRAVEEMTATVASGFVETGGRQ